MEVDKLLLDYGAQLRAATTVQVDSILEILLCWATSQIEKVQPKKSIENIYPLTERFLNSNIIIKKNTTMASSRHWGCKEFTGGYQALQDTSLRKHNWNYSVLKKIRLWRKSRLWRSTTLQQSLIVTI